MSVGVATTSDYLQALDYVIIVCGVTLSCAYGLYHGVRSRKESKDTTFEYLLASRSVGWMPIAASFFASLTSTGTIIGYPAEVYSFGLQFLLVALLIMPCTVFFNEIFLPIFYHLNSGSLYEYVEMRFNSRIKNLITGIAVFQAIILSSAGVYGPATAFSQVTGISTWLIVVIISFLCILYTTFGGMRAVIVADAVQAMLMFLSMGLLLGFGIYYVGDIREIFRRNLDTHRLDLFDFDFNPDKRVTVWTTTVAYIFTYLSLLSTSQFLVQRFMTATDIAAAKRASLLGNFLFVVFLILAQFTGVVMYATFHGCDPFKSGLIQNMNQLVPAYLMKVLSPYLALPGIIFTGIMCACLSTLSSVYNSTATILYNMLPTMSGKRVTLVCKLLVFSVGVLSTLGVAVAELFPNVLQSSLSIYSAVSAPLLGMLLIGIFCPQANIKAMCISFICSVCLLMYVIAGTLVVQPTMVTKPLTVDLCDSFNDTAFSLSNDSIASGQRSLEMRAFTNGTLLKSSSSLDSRSTYFPLSSMSYLLYSAVGTLSTFIIFVLLSIFIGKETSKPVDLELVPEVVQTLHRLLPKCARRILLCDVYHDLSDEQKKLRIDVIALERL